MLFLFTTGLRHSAQSIPQITSPVGVAVAVDTVVEAVVADTSHPLMVVQTSVVILCTVELPVAPEKNEVDKVTVSVHCATAELAVHVGEAELVLFSSIRSVFPLSCERQAAIQLPWLIRDERWIVEQPANQERDGFESTYLEESPVVDCCDTDFESEGLLSSSCISFPNSLRVSVRFSISEIGGKGSSTALTRLSTTFDAQLTRFAASLTRSVNPDIMLLLLTKSLKSRSVTACLFLFKFEQSVSATGLTFNDLNRESVSCFTFLTLSTYCCLNLGFVIWFRSA